MDLQTSFLLIILALYPRTASSSPESRPPSEEYNVTEQESNVVKNLLSREGGREFLKMMLNDSLRQENSTGKPAIERNTSAVLSTEASQTTRPSIKKDTLETMPTVKVTNTQPSNSASPISVTAETATKKGITGKPKKNLTKGLTIRSTSETTKMSEQGTPTTTGQSTTKTSPTYQKTPTKPKSKQGASTNHITREPKTTNISEPSTTKSTTKEPKTTEISPTRELKGTTTKIGSEPGISTNSTKELNSTEISANGTRVNSEPGSSTNVTTKERLRNQSKTTDTPMANNGSIPSASNTKAVQSTGGQFVHHGNMFPAFFMVILVAVVATYFCYHNRNKIQTFLKTGYSRTKHKGSGYLTVKLEDDIDLPRDANRHYVY